MHHIVAISPRPVDDKPFAIGWNHLLIVERYHPHSLKQLAKAAEVVGSRMMGTAIALIIFQFMSAIVKFQATLVHFYAKMLDRLGVKSICP